MVGIAAEHGVRRDVPQIVDRQHHSRLQLALNTNIHLDRARGLIIRVIQVCTGDVGSVGQNVSYVDTILRRPCRKYGRLILLLQRDDLLEYISNRVAANLAWIDGCRKRQRLRVAVLANVRCPKEQALLQAAWTVEQHVVPDGVFIEQANASADDSLTARPRRPREPDLRCKVAIRLPYRLLKPRIELVVELRQLRNSGEIAVGSSGITH